MLFGKIIPQQTQTLWSFCSQFTVCRLNLGGVPPQRALKCHLPKKTKKQQQCDATATAPSSGLLLPQWAAPEGAQRTVIPQHFPLGGSRKTVPPSPLLPWQAHRGDACPPHTCEAPWTSRRVPAPDSGLGPGGPGAGPSLVGAPGCKECTAPVGESQALDLHTPFELWPTGAVWGTCL